MAQSCEVLSIPQGYKIHTTVTFFDAFTAFNDILATDRQFKYTSAEVLSKKDTVKLTEHFAICPDCGQHTPAYRHFVHDFKAKKCFTRQDAHLWSTEVMSLFETEDKKIDLYRPISEKDAFKCMHCGSESKSSDQNTMVTFIRNSHKITVSYPLNSIGDIVHVNWTKQLLAVDEFPLCEEVTFNFKRGTTHLTLKTSSGRLLAARDITYGVADLNFSSPLIDLLSKNVVIKRKLKKIFSEFWGKKLPFKECELDIHKFALATAYIGYEDSSFYSYIPYNQKTKLFDTSYKQVSRRLHYFDDLVSLYEQSRLPNMKSIRKIMFNNPVLFFYTEELENMWFSIGEEPNFFCAFLNSEQAHSVLAFLHDFPYALKLYEDVCKEGLHVPFKEMLIKFPKEVNEYALVYASLNQHKKQEAQRKLKRTFCKCLRFDNGASQYFFNMPDRKMLNSIPTQKVGGYVFSSLKTVNDYVIAGQALHNCLGEAEFDTPIVGVTKFGRYVAAIQVDVENKTILQAYLENNRDIDTDECVFSAFQKWCKKNSYDYYEEDFYDD